MLVDEYKKESNRVCSSIQMIKVRIRKRSWRLIATLGCNRCFCSSQLVHAEVRIFRDFAIDRQKARQFWLIASNCFRGVSLKDHKLLTFAGWWQWINVDVKVVVLKIIKLITFPQKFFIYLRTIIETATLLVQSGSIQIFHRQIELIFALSNLHSRLYCTGFFQKLTICDGVRGTIVLASLSNTHLSVGFIGTQIIVSDLEFLVLGKLSIVLCNNQPLAFSKKFELNKNLNIQKD